jgi:nucleotide-binding universal stress UspA family protein
MTCIDYFMSDAGAATSESVFSRVVVGVDGTEPGFEACRQAARLADPDALIEAVAVVHVADATKVGFDAPRVADELEREAEAALDEAVRILGNRARKRFVDGFVTPSLLREIARVDATVVAVGSHGHRRSTEILIGGVAGELLHQASCSVLIARPATDPAVFPRSIVVGMDGSEAADLAFAAARELAARFDKPLTAVTALRGRNVDLARVQLRTPFGETIEAHPVPALVAASQTADLVVVGSRGLHGLGALGSVSERVAHQAKCSVLVVHSVHA